MNVIFGRENRKIVREEGFWRDLVQFGRKNEKIVREGGICLGASLPGSRVFSKAGVKMKKIRKVHLFLYVQNFFSILSLAPKIDNFYSFDILLFITFQLLHL